MSNLNTCAICLSEIQYPYTIYECGHIFCKECIDLYKKKNCAICRKYSNNILTFHSNQDNISNYINRNNNHLKISMYKLTILLLMIMILIMFYLMSLQQEIKRIELERMREKIKDNTLKETNIIDFVLNKIL